MPTGDTIIHDKRSALSYDDQAQKTHWHAPEVVFGLTYEFVRPGDTLLDLGIGSGLSSVLFYKVGVRVSGLDGSSEILSVCAAKGFASELKCHDLRHLPLPYASDAFDHVVCVAVLNSFKDLSGLFKDVARIVKRHGIFAFTVEAQQPGQEDSYAINKVDVSQKARSETAVTLFRHHDTYIRRLLEQNGFVQLKVLEFVAFAYPAERRNVFFKAWVVQRI